MLLVVESGSWHTQGRPAVTVTEAPREGAEAGSGLMPETGGAAGIRYPLPRVSNLAPGQQWGTSQTSSWIMTEKSSGKKQLTPRASLLPRA